MKSSLVLISSALLAVNAASISKRDLPVQENGCNFEDARYFITPQRVSGDRAASYCQSLGGKLVDVDSRNSMDLTAMVNKCLASTERSVRIQTWETNNFGTNHLAMSNEAGPPAVNVAPKEQELYAVCSSVEASVNTPFNESAVINTPLAEAAPVAEAASAPWVAKAETPIAEAAREPWAAKAETPIAEAASEPWVAKAETPIAEAAREPWAAKAETPIAEAAIAPIAEAAIASIAEAAMAPIIPLAENPMAVEAGAPLAEGAEANLAAAAHQQNRVQANVWGAVGVEGAAAAAAAAAVEGAAAIQGGVAVEGAAAVAGAI